MLFFPINIEKISFFRLISKKYQSRKLQIFRLFSVTIFFRYYRKNIDRTGAESAAPNRPGAGASSAESAALNRQRRIYPFPNALRSLPCNFARRILSLFYLIWFIYDLKTPERGARPNKYLFNLTVWKHLANYLPTKVKKCAEIGTDHNYIFCLHPHGICPFSTAIVFATNGANISEHFPGIKMHLCTLVGNFWFPFRRELMLALGIISCSRESIGYMLSRPEKGNAVALVIGGEREAYQSHPTKHRIYLNARKGFVRLAIKHGASLVPVYHFGETNICDYSGIRIKRLKDLPLCSGQGVIASLMPKEWYSKLPGWFRVGLLPQRRPVLTVVGAPIAVDQVSEASEAIVSRVHAEYCAKLVELFNNHKKTTAGLDDEVELELL